MKKRESKIIPLEVIRNLSRDFEAMCGMMLKRIVRIVSIIGDDIGYTISKEGNIYVNFNHKIVSDLMLSIKQRTTLFAQTPFDKVLGCSNLKELRYEWIWEKTQATGHLNANKMPMKAHENILVFYDRLPTYHPQITHGHKRKVSTIEHKRNRRTGEAYHDYKPTCYDSTDRYPRDVLKGPSDKQKSCLHPTQKPVWLCEKFILTYTNPGDIVLDCCMGSASIGVACLKHGRRYIGMEKDSNIFKTAQARLAQSTPASVLIAEKMKLQGE